MVSKVRVVSQYNRVFLTVRMDFQPVLCYGRGVAPNSFLTSKR